MRYAASRAKATVAPSGPQPTIRNVPRRIGIIRKADMEKRSVVDQVQPKEADIVTKPDIGPIEPSTGISESVIKTGNQYGADKIPAEEKAQGTSGTPEAYTEK